MATQLPFDFETQQASLKRRQAVADALLQQGMTPRQGGMISNSAGTFYAGPSGLGLLAPAALMAISDKESREVEKGQQELAGKYKEGLQQELQNYERTRAGTNDEMGPNLPANPRQAAINAIVSSYAPLRDIGMNDLKTASQGQITAKDLLPYTNPTAVPNLATRGVAGFVPKADLGESGGVIYDKNTRQVVKLEGPAPTRRMENGDLFEESPSTGTWKKLDNAPKITTNVSVSNGDNEFLKKLGAQTAELVTDARNRKVNAERMVNVASRLEELSNQGTFSGPTANIAVTLGQFADTLGLPVDKAKIGTSEEYTALLAKQVANVLMDGSVGRTMTDEDRKRFEQQFPQLVNTPEGRQQIISMLREGARQDIEYAAGVEQNLMKQYPEAARLFNVAPSNVPMPAPRSPAPKQPSVSGW